MQNTKEYCISTIFQCKDCANSWCSCSGTKENLMWMSYFCKIESFHVVYSRMSWMLHSVAWHACLHFLPEFSLNVHLQHLQRMLSEHMALNLLVRREEGCRTAAQFELRTIISATSGFAQIPMAHLHKNWESSCEHQWIYFISFSLVHADVKYRPFSGKKKNKSELGFSAPDPAYEI